MITTSIHLLGYFSSIHQNKLNFYYSLWLSQYRLSLSLSLKHSVPISKSNSINFHLEAQHFDWNQLNLGSKNPNQRSILQMVPDLNGVEVGVGSFLSSGFYNRGNRMQLQSQSGLLQSVADLQVLSSIWLRTHLMRTPWRTLQPSWRASLYANKASSNSHSTQFH